MKKIFIISKFILGTGLLICSLNSCKREPKQEDLKEIAEDQNNAKFKSDSLEDDANFLVDIAEINQTEIEIGKLAQQKGVNEDVKNYSKMLVEDHTKWAKEVKTLAEKKNIVVPTSITETGDEEYNKLNEKTGPDFDKKFAEMMVDGHEKAIDKMTKIAKKATDEEIKLWASNNVSMLTNHLEKAKRLKEKLEKNK